MFFCEMHWGHGEKMSLSVVFIPLSSPDSSDTKSYTIIRGCLRNWLLCAERTVFSRSMAIVTGPTPPGTGVIKDAFFLIGSESFRPSIISAITVFLLMKLYTAFDLHSSSNYLVIVAEKEKRVFKEKLRFNGSSG
jgi:hypothetical protein